MLDPADRPDGGVQLMQRPRKILLGALAAVACVGAVNAARFYPQVNAATGHQGNLTVMAYYRFGVVPDRIVYDLWDVGWDASTAQVMGGLMRFSAEMKDRDFAAVHLAYKGKTKFILDGDDFRQIGREFAWQNPVYLLRTFPEKLRHPDGSRAFDTWSGGVLGVLNAQLEDLNEVGQQWFIEDMLKE